MLLMIETAFMKLYSELKIKMFQIELSILRKSYRWMIDTSISDADVHHYRRRLMYVEKMEQSLNKIKDS